MLAIFQSKNVIFDQYAVEFNRNANFDSNTVETNRSFSQKIFRLKYTRNKSKFNLRIISIKVHCDKQTLQSLVPQMRQGKAIIQNYMRQI